MVVKLVQPNACGANDSVSIKQIDISLLPLKGNGIYGIIVPVRGGKSFIRRGGNGR